MPFRFNPFTNKLDLVEVVDTSGTVTTSGLDAGEIVVATGPTAIGTPGVATGAFSHIGGFAAYRNIVSQTGTSIGPVLTDYGTFQNCSNAATQTVTIPTNASIAFPVGTEIDYFQSGAGQLVFAAAGGVTINSAFGNLKVAVQYSGASIKKIATDTWILVGNLTA